MSRRYAPPIAVEARYIAREREAQAVARPVADPALAQEAMGPVEQFGRAEVSALPRAPALIGALAFGRTPFWRNDPISDLAAIREFAAEFKRRLRPRTPLLALDPEQHRLVGAAGECLAVSGWGFIDHLRMP